MADLVERLLDRFDPGAQREEEKTARADRVGSTAEDASLLLDALQPRIEAAAAHRMQHPAREPRRVSSHMPREVS